jgi:hypothetical protein
MQGVGQIAPQALPDNSDRTTDAHRQKRFAQPSAGRKEFAARYARGAENAEGFKKRTAECPMTNNECRRKDSLRPAFNQLNQ